MPGAINLRNIGGKGKEVRATRIVTLLPEESQEDLLTIEELRAGMSSHAFY